MLPVSSEDQMGVSIHQARRDQLAFCVDHFIKVAGWNCSAVGDFCNNPVFYGDSGVFIFLVDALFAAFVAVAAYRCLQAADIFNQYFCHFGSSFYFTYLSTVSSMILSSTR